MADKMHPIAAGLLLLVVGVAMTGAAGDMILQERQYVDQIEDVRANSEQVNATVLNSTVEESSASDDSGGSYPVVYYRYTYEGNEYTSRNVFPGERLRKVGWMRAREIVNEYERGDPVTVHVYTKDPSHAYLLERSEPRTVTDDYVTFGFGLLGLLSIYGGLRGLVGELLGSGD